MTALAKWTLAAGMIEFAVAALCLAGPVLARKLIASFPRSKTSAWAIAFVDLFWSAVIVSGLNLGPRFEPYKPLIYLLTPAIYIMIVMLMNELLAPRALGFLLLLLVGPVLDAARWHASNLSLVTTVMCYAVVVMGITFVLNPYTFRKMMAFWIRSDANCRIFGAINAVVGGVLVGLATTVY